MLIVVLLLVIYVVWVFKKYGVALPFLLLFWIESFWVLISLVYLDKGKYIVEQLRYSFQTGAYIRYILILLPFWILAPIFLKTFTKHNQREAFFSNHVYSVHKFTISIKAIQTMSMILFSYLLINVIVSGSPLLNSNITRLNFYSNYSKLPFAAQLNGYFGPFFIFMNGVFLAQKDKPKYVLRNCLIIVGIMMLYLILMSNKGYPFYLYSILLLLPTLTLQFSTAIRKLKIKPVYIIAPILLAIVIIIVAYRNYSTIYRHPTERLMSRMFALQGHSFWGYDYALGENKYGLDISLLKQELKCTFSNVDVYSGEAGLSRVMYIISPKSVVESYLDGKSRFTGGYWVVCLGIFGVWGTMFYSVIMALIFAMICKVLYSSMIEKNYIWMYIAFTAYYEFYTYFRIGDFSYLLSGKMLLLLFVILFYLLFHKQFIVKFN